MYRELIEKLIEGHSWAKLQAPCSEKDITLGKIERGIQGFSIDLLIEIGIFFGISTDYILIGCEIRNYEAAKELDSVINQLVALKMKL